MARMVKKRKRSRDDDRMDKRKKRNKKDNDQRRKKLLPLLSSSDMLVEIFSRLPMKSTCRFKCVCKLWQSLITNRICRFLPPDPLPIGFFYKQSSCSGSDDKKKTEINFYNFGSQMNSTGKQFDPILSFLHQRPILAPVASHKGFVLCVEKSNQSSFFACLQFVLCNPSTQQWILLPKPPKPHDWYHIKNVVLYCYDNNSVEPHCGEMEFMVVSLCSKNALELEIYSSETGEWKKSILSCRLTHFSPCRGGHVVFEGSIYICDIYYRNVCVYSLKEKRTLPLKLPNGEYNHAFHGCLGVSSGTVCFAETNATCFSVWVLASGVEWVLKHRIQYETFMNLDEFSNILTYGYELWPLAFHPENYMVLARSPSRQNIVLYHIEGGRIEAITDNINIDAPYPVIPYFLPADWPLYVRNTKVISDTKQINDMEHHEDASNCKRQIKDMEQEDASNCRRPINGNNLGLLANFQSHIFKFRDYISKIIPWKR